MSDLPLINQEKSIKETMRCIDEHGLGIAFVIDSEKKFVGVVTDGDVRRAILKGFNLERKVREIVNRESIAVYEDWGEEKIKEFLESQKVLSKKPKAGILKIPVLDKSNHVKDIRYIDGNGKGEADNIKPSKTVLVIGGAGYLGSVLSRKLLKKGYKVVVLDNLTRGDEGINDLYSNNNFKLIRGDIRNIITLVDSIKKVDAVIHLAAIVGDPECARNPRKTIEINYLATKTIAETCKYFQINRFIFASSCSVYGRNTTGKLIEKSNLNPVSLYAETKIKCEQSILETMDENFSPTILRMGTLYGWSPNMRFDLVVNLLTAKAIFEKRITIFGGEQWRPFLHVEDAADAYLKCLEAPIERVRGEIFNVISKNHKIREIGEIVKSIFKEADIEMEKASDKRDYRVSSDKIKYMLGYEPRKTVEDGIMEIKSKIDAGMVRNYKDPKYLTSSPQV